MADQDCANAIRGTDINAPGGSNPLALLNTLEGSSSITIGGLRSSDVAETHGAGLDAKIIVNVGFGSYGPGTHTLLDFDTLDSVTVNGYEYQTLAILHELSHATGRYTHDPYGANQELISTDALNIRLTRACLKVP